MSGWIPKCLNLYIPLFHKSPIRPSAGVIATENGKLFGQYTFQPFPYMHMSTSTGVKDCNQSSQTIQGQTKANQTAFCPIKVLVLLLGVSQVIILIQ